MMKQLQSFTAMSQMKRLALLLLARTFTDKDVIRLKVSRFCLYLLSGTSSLAKPLCTDNPAFANDMNQRLHGVSSSVV